LFIITFTASTGTRTGGFLNEIDMYFPRPQLKRRSPGLALEPGTREGASRNSRFSHFFVGRGFDSRLDHADERE
jgi:hypothetical protein